jgi:hypothetical protein
LRAYPTGARLDDMPNQSAPDMRIGWTTRQTKLLGIRARFNLGRPSSIVRPQMGNCVPNKYPIVANELRCRGRRRDALSHRVGPNLRARALAPVMREIWAEGFMSCNAVARELNRRGVPTLRGGKQWYPMTAGRVLVRLERARLIRVRRPPARRSLLQLGSRVEAALAARMGIHRGVNLRPFAVRRTRLGMPAILR